MSRPCPEIERLNARWHRLVSERCPDYVPAGAPEPKERAA